MSLLTLSAELLLCIASSLQQQELLDLSLTCKHLQSATEPELFREYSNVSRHRRSFLPFLRRIIRQPDLGKHTRKLNLRPWTTLGTFWNRDFEPDGIMHENRHKRQELGNIRGTKLTAADYTLLVQAARDTEVIRQIPPFDRSTCHPEIVDKTTSVTTVPPNLGGTHAFDRTFCERLCAGSEDPLVILLIALLPNVRDIVLDGVPGDVHALSWQPKHGFPALRTLTACAIDGELQWPLTFFQRLLASGRLRVLQVSHATSGRLQHTEHEPMAQELPPLALLSGTRALERIELENCCLRASDLRSLLQGCRGLKSFLYTSRRCEVGPWSPSPAKFVELLRPHETTLHALILDLDIHRYEDKTDDRLALIQSLAHMTALRVLVTAPEMWHSVAVEDTVVTNDSVGDLVRMRTVMLPDLTTLLMGGIEPVYVEEAKRLYLDLEPFMCTGPQELHAEVGPTYVRSVFDTWQCPHHWTEVKWAEQMYVAAPSEICLFVRAYERIRRELPQ
ncbi:hypothetical protein AA0119_g11472 [Alternaria tenuissima]|uniref:F-box domain-containing protein n=2 Tax=Alternaria alternata complex TaxID=187734 RepID=A0A4Q4N1R6_ALTAL|nr:hypothetical protein AA0117_g12354 [Alternaria alternata]RYN89292.1 hypothetical protein AA0119_g11472 [Alternaria tenuissima]